MCGICGVAFSDKDRPVDAGLLARMTAALHHRGPDGRGFHEAPGIALGVTRLSIVDLDTGDQPISNEDGTVTVICNGEIYNQATLREQLIAGGHRFRTYSDVEVIVHLYEDHGVDCLRHLRGMFGFALWDARNGRLLLARDRLGIKPVHYALTGDACYFGSEQKAILASGAIDRRLNIHALGELMTLGLARTPNTFVEGISRLPAGHYLLYEEGKASVHEYWDVDFTPRGIRYTAGEWAEALREQLTESVRLHLMSDVPVGAWLSAGLDSTSIVALMNRLGQRAIPTVTLAFEHPDFDEIRTQKLLYDFPGYDLEPHVTTCTAEHIALLPRAQWHAEDPVVGGVEIPRMLLAREAAEHVKVVLTGEGSDELLGGYDYFRVDKALRPFARLPRPVRRIAGTLAARRHPRASQVHVGPHEMRMARYSNLVGPIRTAYSLLAPHVRQALADSEQRKSNDAELRVPDAFESWDPFSQLQYYEMKIRLPDRIESSLDRASMAHSLEARVPFLDHVLVEFCAGIPASVKMRWLREKQVLRDAMRGVLPREIVERRKRGLASPVKHWLREPLPEFAAELLSDVEIRRKGYFDPVAVAQLRARCSKGKGPYERELMPVLMVQLWDAMFIRQSSDLHGI
ncbi:MAG: asparagine synthase (glutamine-hydrolyzing) [Gemmatimonadaceae bacterium]